MKTSYNQIQIVRSTADEIQPYQKHLHHSLFITPQWVESMAINDCSPLYLMFKNNDAVVGFHIGLVVPGSKLQGTQLYFYAGPAVKDNDIGLFEACLNALKHYAKKNGYSKVSIRPFDQQLTIACSPNGYRRTNSAEYTYHFGEEDSSSKLSYGFKKNIKKGRKTGANVQVSQHQRELQHLFKLIDQTHAKRVGKYGDDYNPLGLLNLSKESISRLLDTDLGLLYYVEVDQNIHCIQFCLEDDTRNYALLMGSDEFTYQNGLGSFLDYTVEQTLKEKGFRYLNLGSVPGNQAGAGLIQYKEAMGCKRQNSYGYYTYFLTFPLNLLNPVYKAGNILPDNTLVRNLKNAISKLISKQ
jgi:lipid II:glycine glycyltransferase (peptidoglycan interpeptide bridge formation enzyme)